MGDSGSPPERWNLIGQLDKGIKECRKRGCLDKVYRAFDKNVICLLYTSDAADDLLCVDLGGRRIIKNKKKKKKYRHRTLSQIYTTQS